MQAQFFIFSKIFSGQIKFPIHCCADVLQGRFIIAQLSDIRQEHRAEEDRADDVELTLDLRLIPAGLVAGDIGL